MSEMIDLAYDSAKEDMQKAMDRLDTELRKIRAGKAHPSMLDSVKVDYYGALTPLESGGQCVHDRSADADRPGVREDDARPHRHRPSPTPTSASTP